MQEQETVEYLEQLAASEGVAQLVGGEARLGLERLEVFTSTMVAPWIEGFTQSDLRSSVFSTELFGVAVATTQFVDAKLPRGLDRPFGEAWHSYKSLIHVLQATYKVASDHATPIVALFFSAIVLRISFQAILEKQPMERITISPDEKRVARGFFEAVKARASFLPLNIIPIGNAASELTLLPLKFNAIVAELEAGKRG